MSVPASCGRTPEAGLEQPANAAKAAKQTAEKTAKEGTRTGTRSKVFFVKVARRLCQLPV
jgi:hypothetical protein